ncbi:MAG: DUF2141 domain-containing protein [Hyphomonadaceae bacterium]|nr:DUF2141 domain-containing protein [Hyphomonadaceae bacterium]
MPFSTPDRIALRGVLSITVIAALALAAPRPATAEAAAPVVAEAPASSIALTVRNVRPGAGPVRVVLFDSEGGWKGEARPVRGENIDAAGAEVAVTFTGLKPGVYGVKLFQDIDGDGRMGANPFGVPTEPYAFSNDAPVRFGPPNWQAAQFTVAPGVVAHSITLPE